MKVLFISAVLLVATHSAYAATYIGEIEKIAEPIQVKLTAYSATEETTSTMTGNLSDKKSIQIATNETCQVQVTTTSKGLHSVRSCQSQTGDKITQFNAEADFSPNGKLLGIQIDTNNPAMQQALEKTKAAFDQTCLTEKVVTGSKFCDVNLGDMLGQLGMPQSKKPDNSSTVLGWGNYQGTRVLVISTNLDTTLDFPKELELGTLKFKAEGYSLIDPQTGATLFGDSNIDAEFPIKGQKLLMRISSTNKTTYK